MHVPHLLVLGFSSLALASPTPNPQGVGQGADSCASDPLTVATWTNLKIDDFLVTAATTYTKTATNNIQSLAASFGSPNFFCGLDNFCNAGQPCLPIKLPAWYAAIAIQNWNNYMNSLNTAITFAASILSLKLGDIVTDIFPDPKDDITPLKNLGSMFGTVLSIVPFTGPVATASGFAQQGLSFITDRLAPPAPVDKFLAWSNIASSMGDIVREYQSIVSKSIKTILDAEIDNPTNGISAVIKGGGFLGVSQNFTQTDLQDAVIDSITFNAIGLALQAQKIFITRFLTPEFCKDDLEPSRFCFKDDATGGLTGYSLIQRSGDGNAQPREDIAKVLLEKYGMTKEQLLKGPADCFDANQKRQLTNPFEQPALPGDARAPCVFNLLVCDVATGKTGNKGIIGFCKEDFGIDV